MGIFGRDEHTDSNKPSAAEPPQARQKTAQHGDPTVTLIAKPNTIEGKVRGSGEVRIEGTLKGKLDCSAPVIVAQGGEVEAELKAETVTVAGLVRGNILASQRIELTPSADVQGDITSPRILIREGATFEGQVYMTDPGKKPAPRPPDKPAKDPHDEPKTANQGDGQE
jgi:cytoskeletal protein CcmA (bactofilin family)